MASVVFLRGVNVGGHKAFRPSDVAAELAALRVVSIGAAGTFVVHADADESRIRREFLKRLPFEARLMVSPARDVIDLVAREPFSDESSAKCDGQFICVLENRLPTRPRLPLYSPEGQNWQVGITGVHGRFVVALWRRVGRNLLYPNLVVEKRFGVPATTRNWKTILRVRKALGID
jgi:uncharacterized protein (DUF1697 family)